MNTPADSYEAWDQRVEVLSSADDSDFEEMAIPERNAILDEIRRIEETLEARAEKRRTGYWAIPSHVREGLGLL